MTTAPSRSTAAELGGQSWAVRRKWTVCGLLLGATALSYLDRQAFSVAAPLVRKELNLDNAELGLLLSAFFYAYSAMHIFVGWILDRFDTKRTYAGFVAAWSLAQIMTGLARGFGELFGARLALGAFETAGQTGAARIIARLFPAADRAFANGIMMSGGSLGAIIAPVLVIWLAGRFGWRSALVILGVLGFVWVAAWMAWFRPGAAPEPRRDESTKEPWTVLLSNSRFWCCALGAAFTIPVLHVSSSWIPTYFVQRWNLPVAAALSGYLFVIYLGLDVGFVGGGWLVRRWSHGRSVAAARKRVMILSAVLMLAAAMVPFAWTPAVAAGLVFLLNAGRASWGAIFLAFNQDVAPQRVGVVAGAMGCIGAFAGALLVWLIGIISKTHGFDIPFWMLGSLAAAGTIPVLAAAWEEEESCTT